MAMDDLTDFELRLFEWIRQSDFEEVAWSSSRAAKAFKVPEKDIYEALAALSAKIPGNIYIHYDEGAIRISAD